MNQIKEFTKRYYKGCKNQRLNLISVDNLPTGEFDRYTMGVTFSGIDQVYLSNAREVLSTIEKDSHNFDINEKIPAIQLIARYPDLISLVIGQELMVHEYFHLFQTLTLPSCFSLYKASRELASLKVTIFIYFFKLGGKLPLNDIDNIFDAIDLVEDLDVKVNLKNLFDLYKNNIAIIENFYEYSEKNSNLNIIDLMEGAAYTFQKLINRSTDIDTFHADKNSCYKKANAYFINEGGNEDVLFLILAHMSLKYGLLDDGDFMEFMFTPQELFESLCLNIAEYESFLSDIPFQIGLFGTYAPLEKLKKWGFNVDDIDFPLPEHMSKLNDKELFFIGKTIALMDMVKIHIRELFIDKGIKFTKPSINLDDPRALAINANIKEKFLSYSSNVFFALLLVSFLFSSDFFLKHLPKAKDVKYKGLFEEDTSTKMDDNLYKLVDDIDIFLQFNIGYCCEQHGKLPYRKLVKNNSDICLNQRIKNIIGVGLEGIVQ